MTSQRAVKIVSSTAADHLSDEELVARAIDGDAWAKEALFRRHVAAVTGTVVRLLGMRSEAEDIVQDTFAIAFGKLERLRDRRALRGWLLQIAVRRIYRRLRRLKLLRFLGLDRATDEATLERLAYEGASPEVCAELALVDGVLASMPADQRLAWMLRYVEGESLEDVARILECSLATAKRRIKAAADQVTAHIGVAEGPR